MRLLIIIPMLSLLAFCGCGEEQEEQEEQCLLDHDGFFELVNLDIEDKDERPCKKFDGTLVEMPFTGTTGYLILRDQEGNDYRFKPVFNMEWEKQLDGLQIGRNYHFVISIVAYNLMLGLRICDEEGLLYLAASYSLDNLPAFFLCDFGEIPWEQQNPFEGTELEGFTYEQLPPGESKCRAREVEDEDGCISLITNLPVTFQYEDQFETLYQSQEATFVTPEGDFLVHVLYSQNVEPRNYDDGGGGYSFYVRRLRE